MILSGNQDTILTCTQNGVNFPFVLTNHKLSTIQDINSKHHADYYGIKVDLLVAIEMLEYYKKQDNDLVSEVFWKQSIILLGRTFNKGNGRNVKLEKQIIKKDSQREQLEYFLDLRNKYLAHQDINNEETHQTLLVLSPTHERQIINIGYLNIRTANISESDITKLYNLIKILIEFVQNKIDKLQIKILRHYANLDIEELYKASKTKMLIAIATNA